MRGICSMKWTSMRYRLLLVLFLSIGGAYQSTLIAQEERVILQVRYAGERLEYREAKSKTHDVFLLEVGNKGQSNFYSEARQMRDEITAEMIQKGLGLNEIQKELAKYPRCQSFQKIYRNYPRGGRLTLTTFLLKYIYYEEEYEVPQWKLLPDTMTIAGYLCQAAVTKYRGREWRVFYAPDIAIDGGPWKLGGLPGLILSAEDSKGDYSFECIGIDYLKSGEPRQLPRPDLKKYTKCTLKDFWKMLTFYYKDFKGYQRSIGFPTGAWDVDGKPLVHPSRTAVLPEL